MEGSFDSKDLARIEAHGLTVDKVEKQIDNFRRGFGYLPVSRAAVVGDGILRLSDEAVAAAERKYESLRAGLDIVKFVPASGAATRMFRDLFEFLNEGKHNSVTEKLLDGLDRFAFRPALDAVTGGSREPRRVVEGIVGADGLDYGSKPKALILFHSYPEGARTALEEHLVEGAMYAAGRNGVRIHFTVSPEHLDGFKKAVEAALPLYASRYGVDYDISYSFQKSSTDTIAVTPANEPFRDSDGSLVFRPAGHGALLDNLDDIDADVIFIKTVDNVTTDRLKDDTVRYKKVLAGLLLALQERSRDYQARLAACPDEGTVAEAADFVAGELNRKPPVSFARMSLADKADYLRGMLDRPIRVCGMVRNEGEPGGGPFWVDDGHGGESLQIAESSQISPGRADLMFKATHFNPVDVVCGVRDASGRKFALKRFVDPDTGFISNKSKDGRPLKAQELPGLWNGSMALWNTVFVEVPMSTFSPVKVVTDLLREQHS